MRINLKDGQYFTGKVDRDLGDMNIHRRSKLYCKNVGGFLTGILAGTAAAIVAYVCFVDNFCKPTRIIQPERTQHNRDNNKRQRRIV